MTYRLCLLTLVCAPLAACGSDSPADVAGEYTVAITNRDNGCELDAWTVGASSTGIVVTITQDASDKDTASVAVGNLAGLYLRAEVGDNQLTGSVDGDHLDLEVLGTVSRNRGNCTYTINATIDGDLDGDTLTGKLRYHAATNNGPDCGTLTGCESLQDFNGTRPPR